MAKQMLPARFSDDAGHIMSADELEQIDIFRGIGRRQLERFPGTVVRRTFEEGDLICREGEGGTTAFYILEGEFEILIGRRSDEAAPHHRWVDLLGRMFGQSPIHVTPNHPAGKLVPIDASIDLEYGQRTATLGPGEVFGEMSCLNLAPRSATVVARTGAVCLEILRNMYELLQRNETFRQRMDGNYRNRAMSSHLRNVPLLRSMKQEDIDQLCRDAELIRVEPGEIVFREGDPACSADDERGGMFLVRLGQVRVVQAAPGGERTLAYLTKGDPFGETGLLRDTVRNATCVAVDHPVLQDDRQIRCGHVELVRITTETFERITERYPRIKGELETLAEQRIRDARRQSAELSTLTPSDQVEQLGLFQGQNLMLIDLERCTRCDQCVDACVAAHDDGVTRLVREGPEFDKYQVPGTCRMCRDPVCMIGCPVGSIRRTEDLNIMIEDWCIGCGLCARQCPYDAIQMHDLDHFDGKPGETVERVADAGDLVPVTERAVVCDQCRNLPTGPACVYACPHDAAIRVDARPFLAEAGSKEQRANATR